MVSLLFWVGLGGGCIILGKNDAAFGFNPFLGNILSGKPGGFQAPGNVWFWNHGGFIFHVGAVIINGWFLPILQFML